MKESSRGKSVPNWPEQKITQVVKLYGELKSTFRVAAEVGVAPETVRKVLRQQGVKLRSATKPVTPQQIKKFEHLKRAGWTINAIAHDSGVAPDTVTRHLKRSLCNTAPCNTAFVKQEATKPTLKAFREDFGSEPLRVEHPVVMRGLWRGLDRWRGFSL